MPPNSDSPGPDPRWQKKDVALQDVVLSNSWALQAILEYLDEQNPGARERIFEIYQELQKQSEQAKQQYSQAEESGNSDDLDRFDDEP